METVLGALQSHLFSSSMASMPPVDLFIITLIDYENLVKFLMQFVSG